MALLPTTAEGPSCCQDQGGGPERLAQHPTELSTWLSPPSPPCPFPLPSPHLLPSLWVGEGIAWQTPSTASAAGEPCRAPWCQAGSWYPLARSLVVSYWCVITAPVFSLRD